MSCKFPIPRPKRNLFWQSRSISLASSFASHSPPCMTISAKCGPSADSFSFHVFLNHSESVWHLGNKLDHLGIVLVIWGSMVPIDYFGFPCRQLLQGFYICIVSDVDPENGTQNLHQPGYSVCCMLRSGHTATKIPHT